MVFPFTSSQSPRPGESAGIPKMLKQRASPLAMIQVKRAETLACQAFVLRHEALMFRMKVRDLVTLPS